MTRLTSVFTAISTLLAVTAYASPINQTPLTPENLNPYNITLALFADLEELSRIVDITYCVGTGAVGISEPFNCLSHCAEFPSFQLVTSWNTGPLLSDSCGYIAVSHPPAKKRVVVAFRGTYSITNALVDLSSSRQEYVPYPPSSEEPGDGDGPGTGQKCMGCGAHKGFLESWKEAAELVVPEVERLMEEWGGMGYELTLVGHSLGGAVAALAALEFQERGFHPVTTTFGEPRVGNLPLANYMNRRFTPETYRRVTHHSDPVPLLPFGSWGFTQHETEFYIDRQELPATAGNIRVCEGNEDPTCASGGSMNIVQLLWAHRDYFHRLGLCVPASSYLHGHK